MPPVSLPSTNAHAGIRIGMYRRNVLYSAMQGVSRPRLRETQAGSGVGGHEGGEDVVRVPVQVLAGPVVATASRSRSVNGAGGPAGTEARSVKVIMPRH